MPKVTALEKQANDGTTGKDHKYSELAPDDYLRNLARIVEVSADSWAERHRARQSITMLRRHRGSSPADLFGSWTARGTWKDSHLFNKLHTTNIFQSLVRGAEASFAQARILLDIQAKQADFAGRATEKIARAVYEILNVEQWDEAAQQKLFYSMALTMNGYVISRFDRTNSDITLPIPEFTEAEITEEGQYVCTQCFETGAYDEDEAMECPHCGGELFELDSPEKIMDFLVTAFSDQPAGKPEICVVSGLQVSVDDRNGQPADIESANWVEWRQLCHKNEIKRIYGYECEGSPQWSYQTRLQQAFKRHYNGEYSPKSDRDKSYYELRTIWWDKVEYEDYCAPKDCRIHNTVIRRGDKFKDIFPDGMVMGVIDGNIVFVEPENKNEHIKSALWLAEGESFYGIGMSAGVGIQTKISHLDTVIMEGESRSIKGSLVYDPLAVNGNDLEGANTNIPLKPDYAMGPKGIGGAVMPLQVEGLSPTSAAFLASQTDTMQRVMGVPDVALGIGDENSKTASGQQLISQNARGILVPAKKSEGRLKEGWLFDQLRLIQKFYGPEAIQQFGQRYGEEWLPEEIDAFLNADLSETITIDVVEGSEMPETRFERQQKLRADIAAGFIQPTPEVMATLARESGLEGMDLGGYDSNKRIAQKRQTFAFETVPQQMPDVYTAFQAAGMLTSDENGVPITDEAGNAMPNPLIQQILTAPEMRIDDLAENHDLQFGFWGDKARQILGSTGDAAVSQYQIAICNAMMTRHKMTAFASQVKDQTLAMATTMPQQVGGRLLEAASEEEEASSQQPEASSGRK